MKKWIIFTALKIAEIVGIVFVPWGIGIIARKARPEVFEGPVWLDGIVAIGLTFIVCLLVVGLFVFARANYEWAQKLANK